MANTYPTTQFPLGSTEVKVLFNNASNFDAAMNSELPSFYDRFNLRRETWAGMQKMVADFIEAFGWEATHLVYVDGTPLTVLRPTQLIDRAGSVYKVKMPATFPVNLTGTWVTDQLLLVDVGDASLRSELASATGATLVGYGSSTVADTLDGLVQGSFGVNVKALGAVGDGVTDDTAVIQAAFDSLPSGKGTIYFPAGIYNYTTLNFDSAVGLHLVGEGAILTTTLRCTSTSAADGVKLRSTFDCTASFITFDHSSALFAGWLVDTRHKPASLVDTQGLYFFRCTFASQNFDKYSAKGLNLDQSTLITFEGCKFGSLLRPVDGQNPAGGGYSNGIRFKNCQSFDNVGYFANYLGEQWTFQDCNFQACQDGQQRIAFSDNTTSWRNLTFINNGVYDALAAGTSYLNLGTGACLTVNGGLWGGRGDLGSSAFLNATGAIIGVSIKGALFSLFSSVFVATAPGSGGWDISANYFTGCVAYLVFPSNVTGVNLDNNVPNISLGTLPGTDQAASLRYNHDGTIEATGAAVVAAGAGTLITFPTAFPTACWDVQPILQSPADTANVLSLFGAFTKTGFSVYIEGTGSSTVRWRAIGK